jgi:hypothetical protein
MQGRNGRAAADGAGEHADWFRDSEGNMLALGQQFWARRVAAI